MDQRTAGANVLIAAKRCIQAIIGLTFLVGELVAVQLEEFQGRLFELLDRFAGPTPEPPAGQLSEEALDDVHPGAGGWRAVEGLALMVRQLLRDGAVLVGSDVVGDGVDFPFGGMPSERIRGPGLGNFTSALLGSFHPAIIHESLGRINGCRRIYTRFDKLAMMFLGFLNFALIVEMLYDLA